MGWPVALKKAVSWGLALWLLASCHLLWAGCTDPTLVQQAQRSSAASEGPSGELRETVTLPDTLNLQQRRPDANLHYWLDTSACADAPSALYVYRIGAPYRAYGHVTTTAGTRRIYLDPWLPTPGWTDRLLERLPTHVHNGRTPTVYALPAGARLLELELTAMPFMPSGLTTVLIGPALPLATRQSQDYDGLSRSSDMVAGISIFIGLVAILLSRRRPADRGLRWFAMGCAVWGLRNLLYINATLPGSGHAAELFLSVGVVFCGVSMGLSALYATALARAGLVRGLLLALLLVLAASAISLMVPVLAMPTRLFSFLLTMVAMGSVAWALLRSPAQAEGVSRPVQLLLGWAMLAQVAAGGHDFGIVLGWRPPDSPAVAFWGFTGLVVAMAVLSGARVVAALGRAENTNTELEQRVAENNAALQASYAAVREAELQTERRQARTQERERLNREMHDGLGAQLITALRGVERGALSKDQVADALQQGLDELRLLMDASDLGRSLHGALLAWRNRWEDRLLAVGLVLEWQLDPALEHVELGSDNTLQIMRVLQEAATNVVKHAGASGVQVCANLVNGSLVLDITDNGSGWAAEPTPALGQGKGRGLRNMRQRSEQMGGTLHITALDAPRQGTRVRLTLAMGLSAQPESAPTPLART